MADMLIKHSSAQWQCACCDKGGRARRKGRKAQRRKETRAWRESVRKDEA